MSAITMHLEDGLVTFDLPGGDPGYPYELRRVQADAVNEHWVLNDAAGYPIGGWAVPLNSRKHRRTLEVIGLALSAAMIYAAELEAA